MRKKVQRQLSRSVTRPPKVGPMIGPITPPTPHIMMMKGCWLRWNERQQDGLAHREDRRAERALHDAQRQQRLQRIDQAAQHRGDA